MKLFRNWHSYTGPQLSAVVAASSGCGATRSSIEPGETEFEAPVSAKVWGSQTFDMLGVGFGLSAGRLEGQVEQQIDAPKGFTACAISAALSNSGAQSAPLRSTGRNRMASAGEVRVLK